MAILKKQKYKRQVIDLTGPEGNAYALLAHARRFSEELGLDWETVDKELTSGDYENLIQVFDKYFGGFIDLER